MILSELNQATDILILISGIVISVYLVFAYARSGSQ